MGEGCRAWYGELKRRLDFCATLTSGEDAASPLMEIMLGFELEVLRLAGLRPDFSRFETIASASRGGRDGTGDGGRDGTGEEWLPLSWEDGVFGSNAGRCIRVSRETAEYLASGAKNTKKSQTPLDAARVIGVFYQFHLDCAADVRRTVLEMISNQGR